MILSLNEAELLLDPVTRLGDGEFERLPGRLMRTLPQRHAEYASTHDSAEIQTCFSTHINDYGKKETCNIISNIGAARWVRSRMRSWPQHMR